MGKYISALDFSGSDTKRIQSAVDKAAGVEGAIALIPAGGGSLNGVWDIDEAILLPSNVTVLLDGAHLRLKDGVFDNIFRTRNLYEDKTVELSNIFIKGQNGAILDGGVHNQLTEYNHNRDGRPHMYCNNLILLYHIAHYEVSGVECRNPRYWCINQLYCSYGVIKNINFLADGVMPNQDGVNLRLGCHHILVENIGGRTGDDTVALTGGIPLERYYLAGKRMDIHHVVISNVRSTTHQTVVALRVGDGVKLHDVLVDGVESLYDENNPDTFLPWGVVRIGEGLYFRDRASIEGEIYDITVRNVKANGRYGVALSNVITDCVFENIAAVGNCPCAVMTDVKWWTRYPDEGGGVTLKRCIFKDISYFPNSVEPRQIGFYETPVAPAVFLFNNMKADDYFEDVRIDGVALKEGIAFMALPERISKKSLYITNVKQ